VKYNRKKKQKVINETYLFNKNIIELFMLYDSYLYNDTLICSRHKRFVNSAVQY